MSKEVTLVRDIMTTTLYTLKPDTPILAAISMLLKNRISGAPVIDNTGALVGILSEKDCLRIFANEAFFSQNAGGEVKEYMTKNVTTIDPDDEVFKVAEMFLKNHFRRLPVLEDGKVVGQVSRRDILVESLRMVEESPVKKQWTDAKYITEEIKAVLGNNSGSGI